MQRLPIFLHSTILFCFFVFSTACHPPLFLVENADAKSADLWAFACRFSTMLKISTKKLPNFPAFSTGANALSTGVSRVFHHQWSFLTGKQQKGIRRTDTPRFALRARHSRESRRLRLRFSPLRSESSYCVTVVPCPCSVHRTILRVPNLSACEARAQR